MQTSNKSKNSDLSSPSLVPTDSSRFKSFYLTCRRRLLCKSKSSALVSSSINPIPHNKTSLIKSTSNNKPTHNLWSPINQHSPDCFKDSREAAKAYSKRARKLELELELIQLNKWIETEKNLRNHIHGKNETHSDKLDTKRTVKTKLLRLVNEGYIYITTKNNPWGRLVMQISAPKLVQADTRANALQVLNRMASMSASELSEWLLKSMPMGDIKHGIEETVSNGFEKGFMETIVSVSTKKLELLAQEGLTIQMGAKEMTKETVSEKTEEREECLIFAVMIQMRDPEEGYVAFGENMIGLVEAYASEMDGNGYLHIKGVHLAGIWNGFKRFNGSITDNRKHVKDEDNFIWSVSLRGCGRRCNSNCPKPVRNPNLAFASS